MRRRFVRNRQTKGRELVIVAQRGESLDTGQALWLRNRPADVLLRFDYEVPHDGTGATLRYDVEGLVSFASYARKMTMSEAHLGRMIMGVRDVLQCCRARRYTAEPLLFDARSVFVDARCAPRFVFVPLSDIPFSPANSPLTLLRSLGDVAHLHLDSSAASAFAARIDAYVQRQNGVFSANTFRAFVEGELREGREYLTESMGDVVPRACDPSAPLEGNGAAGSAASVASSRWQRGGCRIRQCSNGQAVVVSGPGANVSLGRSPDNALCVKGNPRVSRQHAVLACSDAGVILRDLGSANGTWVEGRRLTLGDEPILSVGQRFALADEEFVVETHGS